MKKEKLAILIFCCVVICFSNSCGSKPASKFPDWVNKTEPMDYSNLNLHISKIYTVPQIYSVNSRYKLTPNYGFQLVVVELQGTAPAAMDIILRRKEITAQSGGDKIEAIALRKENKDWGISGVAKDGSSMEAMVGWSQIPGQFSFSVGFLMKREIKNFKLSCGATIIEAEIMK
jgi:hypothetical protein